MRVFFLRRASYILFGLTDILVIALLVLQQHPQKKFRRVFYSPVFAVASLAGLNGLATVFGPSARFSLTIGHMYRVDIGLALACCLQHRVCQKNLLQSLLGVRLESLVRVL